MTHINITFFCFQPINITKPSLEELEEPVSTKKIHTAKHSVKWIDDFSQYNPNFEQKQTIKLSIPPFSTSYQNTSELTTGFDQYIKNIDAYLIITPYFSHFMLTFEVHLKIPLNDLGNKHNNGNLYQQVREMLVEDSGERSLIRPWAKAIRQEALKQTEAALQESKRNRKNSSAHILPSTGNMSCLAESSNLSNKLQCQLTEQLLTINQQAERLKGKINKLEAHKNTISFNGRFHTLIIQNNTDKSRYIPILYHMQFMWSQLRKLNASLEMVNLRLSSGEAADHKSNIYIASKLVNNSGYLKQVHESFKLSLERDNEDVYCKIQSIWNIENMLSNICGYSDNLNNFIEKSYQRQNSIQQARQSKSLLFIGILQIIALISVWADYIQINTQSTIKSTNLLLLSLSQLNELSTIELIHIGLLPLGVSIVCLLLLSFRFTKR